MVQNCANSARAQFNFDCRVGLYAKGNTNLLILQAFNVFLTILVIARLSMLLQILTLNRSLDVMEEVFFHIKFILAI